MSSESVPYQFDVGPDRTIRGSIDLPPEAAWPAPVVVFCHGFKGFKDWGPWPWFASQLASHGFVVNRFNFSLNGVGPALDRHDEPEKFSRNTYGAEMDDLASVLNHVEAWSAPREALGPARGVIGHSRGGLVALLAGGDLPSIDAIATLGSPGKSRRHTDEQVRHWREHGSIDIPNVRTGQVLQLDVSVIDDYFAQEARYDVARQVRRRDIPTLIIHGDADESVPVEEATWIDEAIVHLDKERVILPGAGHTFGAGHPFEKPTASLEDVLRRTSDWMQRTLAETP